MGKIEDITDSVPSDGEAVHVYRPGFLCLALTSANDSSKFADYSICIYGINAEAPSQMGLNSE